MIIHQQESPTIGHRGFPKALFMVLPEQMEINPESATDNAYMSARGIQEALALAQSLNLAKALTQAGQVVSLFTGERETPDGVFPNNAFATVEGLSQSLRGPIAKSPSNARSAPDKSNETHAERGRYLTGLMRHPSRQLETKRADLHRFFRTVLGYSYVDYSANLTAKDSAELTGSMVIDRARNIGFCGLSSRCTPAGAKAMHEAFGLNKTYVFKLADGEYHTNVVLSALGGRGLVLAESGFADPDAVQILAKLYPDQCIWLSASEKSNFAANCIALSRNQLWMSARAQSSLSTNSKAMIAALGFEIFAVDLSEIEKAGGSLRCMIGEIY
jgi:hypothetical protein